MKNLPLFYYPSTWIWIDDDKTLLNSMMHVFGEDNKILPFYSSKECLNFLEKYESILSKKHFLRSDTKNENYGSLQYTPIDFDVTFISKLTEDPNRYEEVSVMIIDYKMPGMNGYSLLEAINDLPIQRILLTGNAKENEAISGFNDNLIQKFIQKSEPKMFEKLSLYLSELSLNYFEKITAPLLSYLETESPLPLSDPIFVEFFNDFCEKNDIKEYYLIDKQGSFLCINGKNKTLLLIMHSLKSIELWLTLYGDQKFLSNKEILWIKNGNKIPFFGIGREACHTNPTEWNKHFYDATPLDGREKYFFTIINDGGLL